MPVTAHSVLARMLAAAMPDGDWSDYDPKAPNTIWGKAQTMYEIQRGVRWFSTAGHGGLAIADGVARKLLSPAAYKLGDHTWGYVWYEEDVGYAVPFYEHPEWAEVLRQKAGGSPLSKQQLEETVRRNFPQYFKMLEEGGSHPRKAKVGDKVRFQRDVAFGGGNVVPSGTEALVFKVTGSTLYLVMNVTLGGSNPRSVFDYRVRMPVRDLGRSLQLL